MILVRSISLMTAAIFAMAGASAADLAVSLVPPQAPSTTLFHTGGKYAQPRGTVFVGAEAAARDSLLPNLSGDEAFYDDAPRCSLYQTRFFFGHRFTRFCR